MHKETPVPQEKPATLIEYLAKEKSFLISSIDKVKQDNAPKDDKDFNFKTQQIAGSLTIINAKIESLNSFLDNEKKNSLNLNLKLKYFQQLPLNNSEINIQERVARTEALLIANTQTIELINENLELAQQLRVELLEETKKINVWREHFLLEQKIVSIKEKKIKLQEQLASLYQNNTNRDQINKNTVTAPLMEDQAQLLLKNQYIAAIHHDMDAMNIQKRLLRLDMELLSNSNPKTVQGTVDFYKDALSQLSSTGKSLQQMKETLSKEAGFISSIPLKKIHASLESYIQQQLESLKTQKVTVNNMLTNYQVQLKNLISTRQSLAQYNINSWPHILNKIIAIPGQLYKYLKILALKTYDSYNWLDLLPKVVLWICLSLVLISSFVLSRLLKSLQGNKQRSSLTGHLYEGVLVIVQRNIPSLCVLTTLCIAFYFTNISFSNYQLLVNLFIVWFAFRTLILIARLSLLERLSDVSGKDVKLYHRVKWLFLFGGWATALMVVANLYPLTIIVQDIFNRLFMLFILAVSLVAWKSKDVIPYLLTPYLSGKKRYVHNAASLLVLLVPITLFSTAIIGLCGFISLAWTMSGYQVYTLLVLVGYIIIRGLISDVLELFSEWMISTLSNGWLWIEVFLKPLDKVLRVILLLLCTFILFQIFGWHSDSLVMINLSKIANYTLIHVTGIYITVASVIEFFIVSAIFIWASKWTREFCYRWLYKNAKDVAIRNSLSIFTQYAVILIGGIITFHVLGLDLSGMSMILGGLAVGMGFGLRDFASNIVGGVMLLIERPVREGDLITLGEHEGRVAHIGIRTMRVSSWDNMEVLIPNAETFNKPFTNWTLQDSIVRTVIPIKVCRADDPVIVQQLILDVLAIIPEIVPDPPVQVLLKKIDTALIEFEARYFINVQTHSRVEIRSKVLFAITAQFKAAGIKPPVEPLAVEIKEDHRNELFTNLATEHGS